MESQTCRWLGTQKAAEFALVLATSIPFGCFEDSDPPVAGEASDSSDLTSSGTGASTSPTSTASVTATGTGASSSETSDAATTTSTTSAGTSDATAASDATTTGTTDPTSAGATSSTTGDPEPVTCATAPAPLGMVCIEGGTFVNGQAPQLERAVGTFWLDTSEVTLREYDACVTAGVCFQPDTTTACNWGVTGRENHPVNCVDWFQADTYCAWVGKRLPDEWEWEWAARGRDEGRTYPWGEDAPTCARAVMDDEASGGDGCGAGGTAVVGSKPAGASRDGAQDLAGNVWEWTSSVLEGSTQRVLRGGSWRFFAVTGYLRTDDRNHNAPSARTSTTGFRCAQTP